MNWIGFWTWKNHYLKLHASQASSKFPVSSYAHSGICWGKLRPTMDHSIAWTPKVEVISPCIRPSVVKSFSKRLYHDLHEMFLIFIKRNSKPGNKRETNLSQKWGTTISLLGWFQSNQIWLRTNWRVANMGCFTSPGFRFWSSYWVQPENLTWTNMMTLNIFELQHWTHTHICLYVQTRVLGASCFLFSVCFFPHVYPCWPWWPSSVSRADRWQSGRNPAGTWEPSLPEAKEADLFPWYEYYDVNAC